MEIGEVAKAVCSQGLWAIVLGVSVALGTATIRWAEDAWERRKFMRRRNAIGGYQVGEEIPLNIILLPPPAIQGQEIPLNINLLPHPAIQGDGEEQHPAPQAHPFGFGFINNNEEFWCIRCSEKDMHMCITHEQPDVECQKCKRRLCRMCLSSVLMNEETKVKLDEANGKIANQTETLIQRYVEQIERRVDAMWNAPGIPGFNYIVAHRMSDPNDVQTECDYE